MPQRFLLFLIVPLALLLSGYTYLEMTWRQFKARSAYEDAPSLAAKKKARPDLCAFAAGYVWDLSQGKERFTHAHPPTVVVARANQYGTEETVDYCRVNTFGNFTLYLPDATYTLYVLSDLNRDGRIQSHELTGIAPFALKVDHTDPPQRLFSLHARMASQGSAPFDCDIPMPPLPLDDPIYLGYFKGLDHPAFDPKWGELGAFHPEEFMKQTPSLFFLPEKRCHGTLPVLFVHGFSGTPRHWQYLIEHMDHSRFFPLLFYYPSGLRVTQLSEMLYNCLEAAAQNHDLKHMVIVAHSMGGLVARGALQHYGEKRQDDYVPLFVSLCTPYGGNQGARIAIEKAPGIAPCWIDVATESRFLNGLYTPPLPLSTQFHLFFGFDNPSPIRIGENSDGTISLESQLRQQAQDEAHRIHGFKATHVSVLESPAVSRRFNQLLNITRTRLQSQK